MLPRAALVLFKLILQPLQVPYPCLHVEALPHLSPVHPLKEKHLFLIAVVVVNVLDLIFRDAQRDEFGLDVPKDIEPFLLWNGPSSGLALLVERSGDSFTAGALVRIGEQYL